MDFVHLSKYNGLKLLLEAKLANTNNIQLSLLLSWTIGISTRPSKVEYRLHCKTPLVIKRIVAIGFLGRSCYPFRVFQLEGIIQDSNIFNITCSSPQTRCIIPTPHACCSVRVPWLHLFAINISTPLN